jgi:tetratricopeptide (TPR) repeat protein
MSKAIGYLQKALEVDPGYALAWAELSAAYSIEASFGWVPIAEGRERAWEAVKRALELEPELAEGHARLGMVMMARWDWRAAEAALRRALELAPESAVVLNIAGVLAMNLGRIEEALAFHRRVLEEEPLAAVPYLNLGRLHESTGRLAEAEEMWRMALELAPARPGVRASLARVLLDRGSREEALAEAVREPDEGIRLHTVAIIQHASGRTSESNEALKALIEGHGGTAAVDIAEVHAVRGEVDAAFQWLEKAYARRDGGLTDMKTNPRLRSLHGDPRWGALLGKMGLAE